MRVEMFRLMDQDEKETEMQLCMVCGRAFKDGDPVLTVNTYVVNRDRGDYVTSSPPPRGLAHWYHLRGEQ